MKIICQKCVHYFVTWDPAHPHGCRAMNFKSRRLPITEVRMAMQGKDCIAFELKVRKVRHSGPKKASFR
jgi:hypothetical protein